MTTIKRFTAILLVLILALSFIACDNDRSESYDDDEDVVSTIEDDTPKKTKKPSTTKAPAKDTSNDKMQVVKSTKLSNKKMRYVMVYNPNIYDENIQYNASLETGTLGSQIDVNAYRADGLEDEIKYYTIAQSEFLKELPTDITIEGNRAEPKGIDYDKGDTKDFYVLYNGSTFKKSKFTCTYVGNYCHIWTDGSITASQASKYGKEFDTNIYTELVTTFGKPRFVSDDGGKVNILFYKQQPSNLMGFFRYADLFTPDEITQLGSNPKDYNTNHAIIHINSRIENEADIYSTLAHEFQHLINFSSFTNTVNDAMMNTWINEAMSGYIEEKLYPGAKESVGHFSSFNSSDLIRNGQSLYNFSTGDLTDIGVYGSVYLFSKYLEKNAGSNVFAKIHEYWRESYSSTLSVPEALTASVSKSFKNEIDSSFTYPSAVSFDNENEEFMSKLTLNFYLSLLSNEDNIADFNKVKHQSLLYDSIDGSNIEGGGRIIFATNGTTFEIPKDADKGLIYVGLDANFKPVTDLIYH